MKKVLISGVCASLIFSSFAATPAFAAKEDVTSPKVSIEKSESNIAYSQEHIKELLNQSSSQFDLVLPYKEGVIKVPEGYTSTLITNPYTNESFYRIGSQFQTFGLKKWAIVNAFRYGGKALSTVLDVVSDSTATYIRKNSGKIADAIDDASAMIHGEIYQALLSAGVPTFYARNIAWAIDAFLL